MWVCIKIYLYIYMCVCAHMWLYIYMCSNPRVDRLWAWQLPEFQTCSKWSEDWLKCSGVHILSTLFHITVCVYLSLSRSLSLYVYIYIYRCALQRMHSEDKIFLKLQQLHQDFLPRRDLDVPSSLNIDFLLRWPGVPWLFASSRKEARGEAPQTTNLGVGF